VCRVERALAGLWEMLMPWPSLKELKKRYLLYLVIMVVVVVGYISFWNFNSAWLTKSGEKHIESVSLALEVAAVTLGLIAFIEFWRNLRHLESITASLSTRHEDFPDVLKRITTLLAPTTIHKVRVMVDVVDYGYYVDHRWFEEYRARLCSIAGETTATVEVLFCDPPQFEAVLHERFNKLTPTDFDQARRLVSGLPGGASPDTLVRHLVDRSVFEAQGLVKERILLRKLNSRPRLFCWIRDDSEAVIAFPLYDIHPTFDRPGRRLRGEELTFVTQDAHLIQAFIRMFDESYAAASPYP
jgi:hypothetical protein